MAQDKPPQDGEIVAVIEAREHGIVPSDLIEAFRSKYNERDIIEAIQRVFDRGLVELSTGARLVVIQEHRQAYA